MLDMPTRAPMAAMRGTHSVDVDVAVLATVVVDVVVDVVDVVVDVVDVVFSLATQPTFLLRLKN